MLRFLMILLAAGIFSPVVRGQFCSGTTGDTVIYNSFGTGDLPQPAVKGMLPGYFFDYYNRCPGPKAYSVLNFTYDCFGYSWHNVEVNNDHTPNDVNGCFVLVNCDASPGQFYQDTLKNLQSGKNYELSFWMANLMKPSFCNGSPVPNNITLVAESLSGAQISSFNTGVIPNTNTLTWRQVALTFSLPANQTDVIIKMIDNVGGACGNDFVMDDWLLRECGQSNVKAGFNLPNVTGDTARICIGGTVTVPLAEKSAPLFGVNTLYQWQQSTDFGASWNDIPGATTASPALTFLTPDTILFRLREAESSCVSANKPNCYAFSNVIVLILSPGGNFPLSSNSPVCKGGNILLTAVGGATNYTWTGPNNFSGNGSTITIPGASNANSGKYYVAIATNSGCVQYDSLTVSIGGSPVADAGPDKVITAGSGIELNGSSNATNAIYEWSPKVFIDNPNIPNPTVNPPIEMAYQLKVTTPGNCGGVANDEVIVKVLGEIAIPNAFTPNGDGNNDYWRIRGLSTYPNVVVSVYNRFGQRVYQQKGYDIAWNGYFNNQLLATGTYFYVIRLGDTASQQFKGTVTVLR